MESYAFDPKTSKNTRFLLLKLKMPRVNWKRRSFWRINALEFLMWFEDFNQVRLIMCWWTLNSAKTGWWFYVFFKFKWRSSVPTSLGIFFLLNFQWLQILLLINNESYLQYVGASICLYVHRNVMMTLLLRSTRIDQFTKPHHLSIGLNVGTFDVNSLKSNSPWKSLNWWWWWCPNACTLSKTQTP